MSTPSDAIYPLPTPHYDLGFAAGMFGVVGGLFTLMGASTVMTALAGQSSLSGAWTWVVPGAIALLATAFIVAAVAASHETKKYTAEYRVESERLTSARTNFLAQRSVEIAPNDVRGFWPDEQPTEDGLVSMAQGIVGENATTVALHWRDGNPVLTGTDGQELRPLAHIDVLA